MVAYHDVFRPEIAYKQQQQRLPVFVPPSSIKKKPIGPLKFQLPLEIIVIIGVCRYNLLGIQA